MQTEPNLSPGRVRWYLLLICAISTLNFVDRQVVNILAEPIKQELKLADWQVGLLTGLAFSFFYALLSLPAARLAEHFNRPRLLGGAIAIWSVFTALCGYASGYLALVFARFGVAIGESAAQPTAYSLISDYVPREKRASALALYGMGTPLGAMFGLAIGGLVVDHYGWRAAFFVVGLPGLLVAALCYFVLPEPRTTRKVPVPVPPFMEALKKLWAKKAFVWLFVGSMMVSAINYGLFAFVAPFFLRAHGPQLKEVAHNFAWMGIGEHGFLGLFLGLSAGITGVIGALLGGKLTDYFVKRDVTSNLYVPMVAVLFSIPVYATMLFTSNTLVALFILSFHTLLMAVTLAPGIAGFMGLAPPESRATATAIHLIAQGMIGLGMGPVLTGLVSDIFNNSGFGPVDGLRYSMLATKTLALVYIGVLFLAARSYRKEFVS